jgi:hypothetical protein
MSVLRYRCPACGSEYDIRRRPEEMDTVTYCSGSLKLNVTVGTMESADHPPTPMAVIAALDVFGVPIREA